MLGEPNFEMRDFLPYLLALAAEQSSLAFAKHYDSRYGMGRTEWRVLFHLGCYGDLTAREICDRAKLHKTKISRAVAKLEEKRFLTRRAMQDDRRSALLSLTTNGRAAFYDLAAFAGQYEKSLIAALPHRDRAPLKRCLMALARLPDETLPAPRLRRSPHRAGRIDC